MSTFTEGLRPSFEPLTEKDGLEVVDPIERYRYVLRTPNPVSLESADRDSIRTPIDAVTSLKTAAILLPSVVLVYVRDESGTILAETEHAANESFPDGEYTIEINAPIKLYLHVRGSCRVVSDATQTRIEFAGETEIRLGARSHHKHPATTITTTDDPVAMMKAVTAFSSALKATNPERSYPTLRGHPPLVEVGDELHIPSGLDTPETGVILEIPPTYRAIYTVASLAYYLGAELVPSDVPRLHTADFEYVFDADDFEADAERVLKQVFFLDCLARTEGMNPVDLHERRAVESAGVELDFAALYAMESSERLEAYFDVPFSAIEPHLPRWGLSASVEPHPENVEFLPFLVNSLATIRTVKTQDITVSPESVFAASTRKPRTAAGSTDDSVKRDAGTRSENTRDSGDDEGTPYVRPPPTDALETTWVGEGIPLGASKAMRAAYHNRLERPSNEGDIDIVVVCNDTEMDEERDIVRDVYGSREELPFDITAHRNLTTTELREVLAARTEFLHYIGHVDDEGFDCADGKLDATTLDSVNVDSFLLNACWSVDQGMALIKAGSIAGIVTLTDVINSGALRMGKALARLLNVGFPLGAALEVARDVSIVGDEYIVVGDSGLAITQPDGFFPNLCEIERVDDPFDLVYKTYPTSSYGIGSVVSPRIGVTTEFYLVPGTAQLLQVSEDDLQQFLSLENVPVRIGRKLRWSGQIDFEAL